MHAVTVASKNASREAGVSLEFASQTSAISVRNEQTSLFFIIQQFSVETLLCG
jgi:hypothetical protein